MARPRSFAPAQDASADAWNAEKAEWLIGKYALVGVTWSEKDGERSEQYHGRIVSADPATGISIACEGGWKGETFVLPPALEFVFPAQPGEYRLRATGEMVINPDVVTTWRIDAKAAEPN